MKQIGPIVPIVTPCSRSGEIDAQGFRAVCQEMLAAGCAGIFVGGSTGRGPWFDLKDRAAVCRMAADCIQGNTLLLGGCTALGLPGMIDAARVMADSGAQVAVATAPVYFHYDQEEVENIFLKFADSSPLPVMIYDIPEFTNMQFSNDLVIKLANHGNIMGLKDSSANLKHFETLLEALQDRKDFSLFQGKEMYITESLRRGASGFIVSVIHIAPKTFMLLYQAVQAGMKEYGDAIQAGIDRMMELVFSSIQERPESSTLFHILNYALKERGVCHNILLEHDGEAPTWLLERARLTIEIGTNAINPVMD